VHLSQKFNGKRKMKKSELKTEYENTLRKLDIQKKKSSEVRKKLKETQKKLESTSNDSHKYEEKVFELKKSLTEERRIWNAAKASVAAVDPNPMLVERISELTSQIEKLKATI
jgi:septation ring formation regulator EzrA